MAKALYSFIHVTYSHLTLTRYMLCDTDAYTARNSFNFKQFDSKNEMT